MTPKQAAEQFAAECREALKAGVPRPSYQGPPLEYADLSRANLSGVNLRDANLARANLRFSDLSPDRVGKSARWSISRIFRG